MDINRNVFTGMDHLPYKYKDDISCPFRFGTVSEVNGKVVSFSTLTVRISIESTFSWFRVPRFHLQHV